MMASNSLIKNITKASLIGLLAVIINYIPLEKIIGIPSTVGVAGAMPTIYYIPMFFIYGLIALVFANIKSNLSLGKGTAFIVVFSFFFTIDTLLSSLEGNFFIDNYPLAFNLLHGFIKTIIITFGICYLWKQEDTTINITAHVKNYFKSRSLFSWIWRFITILILSFIIYVILGALAYPITGPYMEKLIKIPSMLENFTITILRGIAYLLVTLPIIIFWKNSSKSLFLNLALINILLYPVLGYAFSYFFPVVFRLTDGLVLSLHVTSLSWLQTKLLKKLKT